MIDYQDWNFTGCDLKLDAIVSSSFLIWLFIYLENVYVYVIFDLSISCLVKLHDWLNLLISGIYLEFWGLKFDEIVDKKLLEV